MSSREAQVEADNTLVQAALNLIAGNRSLGQKREPMRVHPFPARLPISVATHLVSALTNKNATVLDPMVGSGTTLVAARQLSRHAIGFDRDHLAVRLAQCASQSFNSEELESLRQNIIREAERRFARKSFSLPALRSKLSDEDRKFMKYWFPPTSQKQCFALADSIRECNCEKNRGFLWAVFSSLIIAKTAGASFARDISRSRPHKCTDKKVVLPFDAWDTRFRAAMARLPFLDHATENEPTVSYGDAREIELPSSSADFVLTSPPYRNAIDYLRSHKFSLVWMGFPLADLRALRSTMIGTERGLWELDGLPPSLERKLLRSGKEPRDIALTRQYLSDLRKVMGEFRRVLKPKGLVVMVIGPTILNSQRSDSAHVVTELAEAAGFDIAGTIARDIDASRRSLPIPQMFGRNEDLGKRMRREIIVAFRKR